MFDNDSRTGIASAPRTSPRRRYRVFDLLLSYAKDISLDMKKAPRISPNPNVMR